MQIKILKSKNYNVRFKEGSPLRVLSMRLKNEPTTPTINVFSSFATVQRTLGLQSKNGQG